MRRLGLIALLIAAACRAEPPATRQLVVLAVDGLDPGLLSRLIASDRLPHLAGLARVSGVVRVTSTPGAESSAAWASFATGVNPGVHRVFDAVGPDPISGDPRPATLRPRASATWLGGVPREGAAYAPVRQGITFWSALGRSGIRSRVLFVAGTFPPEAVESGTVVSGTPLPDWSGAWGSGYTWLGSDVAPAQVGFTRYGGRRERLVFVKNVARATLIGVREPVRIDVPLTVAWSPEARSANITIGDETVHLNEGEQSRWISLVAPVSLITRVRGLVRLQLVKAGNEVQLYVSPIQWHPGAPPSAMSSPPSAAATLFARLGPFRTLSWPEAAWAVADGLLPAQTFVDASDETFDDRESALLNQAEGSGWELVVAGIETLGASSRLLWRRPDPDVTDPGGSADVAPEVAIRQAYLRLDALVGELRARLPAHADIAVVSAYGIAPVRQVVDLNRWLMQRGLLTWRGEPAPVTLAALFDPTIAPAHVDWSRTSARAMGNGHVYFNARTRDAYQPLAPGPERDALEARLRTELESVSDPESGQRLVAQVRTSSEAFPGATTGAPDLVVSFTPGTAITWDSMLGGAALEVVAPNRERWTGGHASVDERAVPGVWLSTMPVASEAFSILDVAPTVMQYFGQAGSAAPEGRPQLRESERSASRR